MTQKLLVLSSSAIAITGLVTPHIVHAAGFFDQVSATSSKLVLSIAQFLGEILIFVSTFLVRVSIYNDFENADFVIRGWTAVRDLSNMFFIIVLLAIAVATILRIEQYSFKRLMFKLLLMALLINFSKSILGFIIEAAQVVMMFFIDAYRNGIEGVLLKDLLHLDRLLDITREKGVASVDFTDVLGVVVGAVIMLIVSIVTVGTIVIVLLFRIVALWILIIFSPLVFLLHAVPSGASYASRWWGMFTKYVITGPILAFFLWLSFSATTQGDNITQNLLADRGTGLSAIDVNTGGAPLLSGEGVAQGVISIGGSISAFFETDTLFSFLVGISLLIGALWATSQLGVMGGGLATKAIGQLQTRGAAFGKGTVRAAGNFSRVTPIARRVGFAAKKTIERVPLARLVTQSGRQRGELAQQGSKLTQWLGGTQARADLASKRAKFLKAKEKEMDERGLLSEPGIMRTQLNNSKDPIEREVLVSKLLEKEAPDSKKLVEEFFDDKSQFKYSLPQLQAMSTSKLKSDKKAQQQMSIFNNFESKVKDKTYVGLSKTADKDGDITFKTPDEYKQDKKKKRNSLNKEDAKKEFFAMSKRAKEAAEGKHELSDIMVEVENIEILNSSSDKVQYDQENNEKIRDTIIDTIKGLTRFNADKSQDKRIEELAKKHDEVRSQYQGTGDRGEGAQKRLADAKINVSVSTPQNIIQMQQSHQRIASARAELQGMSSSSSVDSNAINEAGLKARTAAELLLNQLHKAGRPIDHLKSEYTNIQNLQMQLSTQLASGSITPQAAMDSIIQKIDDFNSQIPNID